MKMSKCAAAGCQVNVRDGGGGWLEKGDRKTDTKGREKDLMV